LLHSPVEEGPKKKSAPAQRILLPCNSGLRTTRFLCFCPWRFNFYDFYTVYFNTIIQCKQTICNFVKLFLTFYCNFQNIFYKYTFRNRGHVFRKTVVINAGRLWYVLTCVW
jgi:hypothetical protein